MAAPSASEVFRIFLGLGLTSFGGPIAHIGYFHREFVARRKWLTDEAFAAKVALAQALPGPASSQVGMLVGLSRAGYRGLLAAWLGFTAPSAALMIGLALGMARFGSFFPPGLLHGLEVAAVAVVAQALWAMGFTLARGPARFFLAAAAGTACFLFPSAPVQVLVLAAAALAGSFLFRPAPVAEPARLGPGPLPLAACLLLAYVSLLFVLPLVALAQPSPLISLAAACYRAGALVFGGGHVVLPLLESSLVPNGLVAGETLMAGYAAAQALPGPLFTLAGFLGAASAGWLGGVMAIAAVFLPSLLLTAGILPWWESLRRRPRFAAALAGVNSAVVGLLGAALAGPVAREGLESAWDWALAAAALAALMAWKPPPWSVVAGTASAAWALGAWTG